MNSDEAKNFCDAWLSSWTGNNPEKVLEFYSSDAFYLDPTVKTGIKGHEQLLKYLTKLLKGNPDWKWTREELFPTEKGFTLKWKAEIPVLDKVIIEYGMDIVEIENGKIIRNEVYFDTYDLISDIKNIIKK